MFRAPDFEFLEYMETEINKSHIFLDNELLIKFGTFSSDCILNVYSIKSEGLYIIWTASALPFRDMTVK